MSRIESTFDALRTRGEKALVLYVTAGDPMLADLVPILETLAEGGADIIEIGIPYSDPIADGPIIQASSQRALDRGVTFKAILEEVGRFQGKTPLVAMGYANTFYRTGYEASARALSAAGFDGTILCDFIPEEGAEWKGISANAGLDTIFLAAPTSTDLRLKAVCDVCTGFVYAVSRTGVTGSASSVPEQVSALVGRLRPFTQAPICVGFGISTPEQVKMVVGSADGAVIGSALVDWLAKNWDGGKGREALLKLVQGWKAATRL